MKAAILAVMLAACAAPAPAELGSGIRPGATASGIGGGALGTGITLDAWGANGIRVRQ